jgi:ABC-type sulfate/molybdate transport systems ATPase subunit
MTILIENLSKQFGNFKALDHVNLEIQTGSLVALVGPSGSGKSTLLRLIAGLDTPTQGRIWLTGRDSKFLSIQEREIGFVFQNYALFKHMTVYENIAFGLTIRNSYNFSNKIVNWSKSNFTNFLRLKQTIKNTPNQLKNINFSNIQFFFQSQNIFSLKNYFKTNLFNQFFNLQRYQKEEIKNRVLQLLELIQLEKFADRYPNQLSGGQRQRIALARALAIEPQVLLLDEPFGALDIKVRKDLKNWLKRLHEQIPITTIFVTHDHQEALEIANEIVLFEQGKISQLGNPKDIYKQLLYQFNKI